ncbi:LPXTG cell wall anchor domain-containing protein [Leifsonia sp. 2MCAF36]|uniref:LPXTG cell wall anchor domain-containing protein n=1 Tax=Leifsonia sp. 2MCAF36 TaxID=3232988 RepID=UPI003F98BEC0
MSALRTGAGPLLIAAGGGGAPVATPDSEGGRAGGGGGIVGGSGTGTAGIGGTQTAGGAAGTNPPSGCVTSAVQGSANAGGAGAVGVSTGSGTGGGGGGGFFGGGGGACSQSSSGLPNEGGGGGGSSLIAGSSVIAATTLSGGNGAQAAGGNSGGSTQPFYAAGIGVGGNNPTAQSGVAGGNGRVVIQFKLSSADLSVTKTVDRPEAQPGSAVVFAITIASAGPDTAPGVTVVDSLPAGLEFVSSDAGAAYDPATGVWSAGDLPAGQNRTLHITAKLTAVTAVTNRVTQVYSSIPDPNPANNTAQATVTPLVADLVTSKSLVGTANPPLGSNVTYNLTVKNNGPEDTTGVTVTDPLPAGLTYVSSSGTGTYDSATGVWSVGNLANGETKTLALTVRVDTTNPVTNLITASGSDLPDPTPCPGDCGTGPGPVTAVAADLTTSKTVDNPTPTLGSNVTFTLTAENAGPSNTTGVVLTDPIPAGFSYVSDDAAGAYNPGTGLWSVGSLNAGQSKQLHLVLKTTAAQTAPEVITDAVSDLPDPTPCAPDCGTVPSLPTQFADLQTSKTVDSTTPALNGNATFTITVTNNGPSGTTNATVTDKLPAGLQYVSDTSGGKYNPASGVWSVGALANGETKSFDVVTKVTTTSPVQNVITKSDSDLPDPTPCPSDCGSAPGPITAQFADLATSKTVDNTKPNLNGNVTFTLTVTNNGPAATTNAKVTDPLPVGLQYVSDTSAGAYDPVTGVWSAGALADGQTKSINIVTKVTTLSPVTNVITATSSDVPDATPCPTDCGPNPGPIQAQAADLVTSKAVDTTTPRLGGNAVFTLTVRNAGPSDTTNASVTDKLPAGLDYVSDTSGGNYDPATGVWSVGALANGEVKSIDIVTLVTATSPVTNVITGSGSDLTDPSPCPTDCGTTPGPITPQYADLVTTKSVDNTTPRWGSQVLFTISVANHGPSNATNAHVTDLLPAGLDYVSDTSGGNYDPATGIWSVGDLANGSTRSFDILATVSSTTPVTNLVTNSASDQVDPSPCPSDCGTNPGPITPQFADLATTKTVDTTTPVFGSNVKFTITVTNNGGLDATNAQVTDKLPAGLDYVSDTSGGAYDAATGVWSVGSLANGATKSFDIVAKVTTASPVTNVITHSGADQADPTPCPTDCGPGPGPLTPQAADLVTSKTVDNATPNFGGNVTYTLTVTNNGPSGTTNAKVTDKLPTGLDYVSDTSGGAYDAATGVWSAGSLANGETKTINIVTKVITTAPVTNLITKSDSDLPDPTPCPTDCGTGPGPVTPSAADLSVSKTVDNPTPVLGSNVTFTLTVVNDGPSDTTGVVLTDPVPAGFSYVSDDGTGSYNPGTGLWSAGALTVGQTKQLHLVLQVTAAQTGAQVVTDAVSDLPDPTPCAPDCGSVPSLPTKFADLATAKTVDTTTPELNGNARFTITVTNNGPSDTANATVTDKLPAGLDYVSDTSGGTYDPATGVWSVGSLANGETKTFDVITKVTVTTPVTNVITNSDSGLPDPTPCPSDCGPNPGPIQAQSSDLVTTKTVDNTTPNFGDNVTFTLTVKNNGPTDATNATVTDKLPAGLDYLSDTSGGTYDPATGVWSVGSLANGATTSFQIVTKVSTTAPVTNVITNSGSDHPDPTPCPSDCGTGPGPITPQSADLATTKTVDNTTPVLGDDVLFTITVTNNGPSDTANAQVTDKLPAGLDYVSDTSGGTYDPATGIWSAGALANGATKSFDIISKVTSLTPVRNVITSSGSGLPDATPCPTDCGPAPDPIVAQYSDLATSKTVDNTTPNFGDNVRFTLTVTNNGPSNATNATVTDKLPTGLEYVSDGSGGKYDSATGVWSIGALANGETKSIVIVTTVATTTPVTNIITNSGSGLPDPTPCPTDCGPTPGPITPQAADLVTTKTVDNTTPNFGDNVTFTVTVKNNGPSDTTNAQVTDKLPAGLDYVSDTSGGTYDKATGIWSAGALANGATKSFDIVTKVNTTTPVTNVISKSDSGLPDPTPCPSDCGTGPGPITPQSADLVTTKTVDSKTPNFGENVTFTLTVKNNGPSDTTGATVTDKLPAGLDYVSDTSGGAYDPATGVWSAGAIANGATKSIDIVTKVSTSSPVTNVITNSGSDLPDPTPCPSDCGTGPGPISPNSADLVTTKTVDDTTPNYGSQVKFTITVKNNGPSDTTNAQVTDKLPAGLDYVSDTSGGKYDAATGVWSVGDLANGATKSFDIVTTVSTASPVTNVINSSGSDLPDPTPCPTDCGTGPGPITPQSVDLVTSKTASAPVVDFGGPVTFTINVTNNGPSNTTNATVTDKLPAGLTYVSDTSGGKYDPATGVWSVGSLANGETKSFDVVTTVDTTSPVQNVITQVTSSVPDLTPCQPANPENCAAPAPVAPRYADLKVTKAAEPADVKLGDTFAFVLTVTNTGNTDTTGVVVVDKMPKNLTYLSDDSASTSTTYDQASGNWTVGDLAVGQTKTLRIQTRADGFAVNIIQNATSALPDPTPCSLDKGCADTAVSIPSTYSDLVWDKTVDNASPVVNQNVTFTLTLGNKGKDAAPNAQLTDPLPSGLQYVSSQATAGTYDPSTGVWNVGTLNVDSTQTLKIVAKVTSLNAADTTNKIMSVTSDNPDPTPCIDGACGAEGVAAVNAQPALIPGLDIPGLAHTGSDLAPGLGIAGLALLVGGVLFVAIRRRRKDDDEATTSGRHIQ